MKVAKEFKFHAAHRDAEAPAGDQCGRLHGHTYVLRIEVTGPLDARGMVIHGDKLKEVFQTCIEPVVEHRYLNEELSFNPTMEAVAQWIHSTVETYLNLGAQYWIKVRLWETPTMYCEVT